ncbi:Hsp20/alpha crystallin family protein [Acholeplasma granularum]|uniref:Hsp20/alpha crystallin family protein n=1 Tax=Acholeplasma granularum TaxID=264635 RepID=UPI00046E9360|nr:Hsp20/alpha crystallin family protein [Acholeplasma granularum]
MFNLSRQNRGFFDDFFEDFKLLNPGLSSNLMKTDIKETDKSYELSVELPGFDKNDVKVSLDNGYLIIEATTDKTTEDNAKDGRFIKRERHYGSMQRSYYVGNLTLDDIKGEFKNGILHLDIPKENKKEPEKRYLEIK